MCAISALIFLCLATASCQGRVLGGEEVEKGDKGWTTSLHYAGIHVCGAVLISDTHVLTAAKCTYGRIAQNFLLVAGTNNLSGEDGSRHSVASMQMHPGFNPIPGVANDISVLTLASPVPDAEVLVPYGGEADDLTGCDMSGWGATCTDGPEECRTDLMHSCRMDCMSGEECAGWVPGFNDVQGQCSMDPHGECAPCSGDVGDPLRCPMPGREDIHRLVGLYSWGNQDCDPGYPSVNTRIRTFCAWIESHTGVSCQD